MVEVTCTIYNCGLFAALPRVIITTPFEYLQITNNKYRVTTTKSFDKEQIPFVKGNHKLERR